LFIIKAFEIIIYSFSIIIFFGTRVFFGLVVIDVRGFFAFLEYYSWLASNRTSDLVESLLY
jgi:hypothetical protein